MAAGPGASSRHEATRGRVCRRGRRRGCWGAHGPASLSLTPPSCSALWLALGLKYTHMACGCHATLLVKSLGHILSPREQQDARRHHMHRRRVAAWGRTQSSLGSHKGTHSIVRWEGPIHCLRPFPPEAGGGCVPGTAPVSAPGSALCRHHAQPVFEPGAHARERGARGRVASCPYGCSLLA